MYLTRSWNSACTCMMSGLLLASSASAATCPGTINALAAPHNGVITLTEDYVLTDHGNCFLVSGEGGVLDLNGHTITVTDWGNSAIQCTSSGISIRDTGSPKGGISSVWTYGIKECENITGVEILGGETTWPVYNDSRPLHELTDSLIDGDTYGVWVTLKGGASRIANNEIRADNVGIRISGNERDLSAGNGIPAVEYNVVRESSYVAIDSTTTDVRIHKNIMYDRDPGYLGTCVDAPAGTPYAKLQCDCGPPYCDEEAETPYDFPSTWEDSNCPGPIDFSGGSPYELTQHYDLAGDSGPCLEVTGGGTIDLNGYTITNSGAASGVGIECAAVGGSNTVTIVDVASNEGAVDGSFSVGIKNCRRIDGVRIMGPMATGVENASDADDNESLEYLKNSIVHVDTTAVKSRLLDRTSEVSRNFLRSEETGVWITGIRNTGGGGRADVIQNLIRDSHDVAIKTFGDSSSAQIAVEDNLMHHRDASAGGVCMDLHGTNSQTRLLCDCSNQCETDSVPFNFPLSY